MDEAGIETKPGDIVNNAKAYWEHLDKPEVQEQVQNAALKLRIKGEIRTAQSFEDIKNTLTTLPFNLVEGKSIDASSFKIAFAQQEARSDKTLLARNFSRELGIRPKVAWLAQSAGIQVELPETTTDLTAEVIEQAQSPQELLYYTAVYGNIPPELRGALREKYNSLTKSQTKK